MSHHQLAEGTITDGKWHVRSGEVNRNSVDVMSHQHTKGIITDGTRHGRIGEANANICVRTYMIYIYIHIYIYVCICSVAMGAVIGSRCLLLATVCHGQAEGELRQGPRGGVAE